MCVCVRAFSDVDECVNGSRCVNGTCSNTEGSYLCNCDQATAWSQPIRRARVKSRIQNNWFLYHPPPTSSLLIGLLVCWLVGVLSVRYWWVCWHGDVYLWVWPVRTHRALTNVRCPAHLAFPRRTRRLHRWAPTGTSFSRDVTPP